MRQARSPSTRTSRGAATSTSRSSPPSRSTTPRSTPWCGPAARGAPGAGPRAGAGRLHPGGRRLRTRRTRVRGGAQHRPGDGVPRDLRPGRPPAADGRFWYALDRSILSSNDGALLGPPANEVFADVAPDDLRALLVEALTWWLRQPGDPGDAVLGACRSLVRFRDGEWLPKVAAGTAAAGGGLPTRGRRRRRRSPDASAPGRRRRARRPRRSSGPCAPRSGVPGCVR